jgi:hypothetical protein
MRGPDRRLMKQVADGVATRRAAATLFMIVTDIPQNPGIGQASPG